MEELNSTSKWNLIFQTSKTEKTENLYLLKAEVCDNMNIRGIRPGKFSLLLRKVRARDQKEVKT